MISRIMIEAKHSTPKHEWSRMFAQPLRYCTHTLATLSLLLGGACQETNLAVQRATVPDENVISIEGNEKEFSQKRRLAEADPFQGVAADEPQAALIGRDILAAGGSAADASLAMYFTLAVTLPSTASLGGGGVCLVHESVTGRTIILDFTATAPTSLPPKATRASATPGVVKGMYELHRRYGRASWGKLIKPAEQLARFGVPVSRALANDLRLAATDFFMDPNAKFIFANPDGTPLAEGDILEQFNLARVLTRLRRHGVGDFYTGQTATALIHGAELGKASLSRADLGNTQALWRDPVATEIGQFTVFTSPRPTAGAVTALQIWAMVANTNRYVESSETERKHLFAESSMRAFLDRGSKLFVDGDEAAPLNELLDQKYLGKLMSSYKPNGHVVPEELLRLPHTDIENPSATSFLVIDKDGLAVACLVSLHNLFGIGRIANETGIVLAAAPNRRGTGPQSLAPMLILDRTSGDFKMIAAATGGAAAPTALGWTVTNIFLGNLSFPNAMWVPRLHHGGRPDRVLFEPGTPKEWLTGLERRGHIVAGTREIGRINAFHCEFGLVAGKLCLYGSDPRGHGLAISLNQ